MEKNRRYIKNKKKHMKKRRRFIVFIIIIIVGVIAYKGYSKIVDVTGKEAFISNNSSYTENTILVNKKYRLDEKYIPNKLMIPNIKFADEVSNEERHVSDIIAKPLERLINEAKNQGVILLGNSAYRSYSFQKKVYNDRVKSQGKKMADEYVAKPGASEHQTGLAIDITNQKRYFVKGTKEAIWLEDNCYKYGFIIRYPEEKESITSISYEPWHIRYVGVEAAKHIYDNNITLEEYLGKE